ncbi:repetitive organellar protein-like isoform X2 [Triplophysa dalaica]|uniref:repetitive organellar protein-like isoform X2 n=1 Tax=Triplophysa dalaica TaxID=1582913 RepID=UPI0024DFA396|nr:repetitive organellar protein-like isoform X2 [Triplophysa dalaica]
MENLRAAQKHNEDVIKDLKKEISEQEMMIENHKAAEKHDEDVIKHLKEEITELKKRNTELEMVKQKQITSERRNDVIKDRDKITQLKKRNTELEMAKQKQKTVQRKNEDVIKDLKEEITELKKRNTELENAKQKQKTVQRKNEDVIKDHKEEITELKKRNIEQQQKISNTEDNLRLIQEKHQKDLSRQQKSSSEHSFKFWFLFVGVLFVLSACFIQAYKNIQPREAEKTEVKMKNNELDLDMQRCKAELKLKWMQQFAVDVTLDPDTAHPNVILSDDEKQVRHGDIYHELPDNPKRFDYLVYVLGKEGFSSGRFYYEVQVKGKTDWTLGVIRESVNRKGDITLTPVKGLWTVVLRNENEYQALDDPSVSLSLSVKPQKDHNREISTMESSSTSRETGSCSKEQPRTTLKAVKLSLVCQSSYSKPHLESHLRESELQKHKLIDPVKNLQDSKCQNHDRPLMLFCRDDQTCVCFICTLTDHKNHNIVPLREFKLQEIMENRKIAQKHNEDVIKDLKKAISEQEMMIEKQKATEKQDEDVIKHLKKEITELKKRNTELEMMEERQKATEKQDEDVIKDLKDEITELKKRNTELEMVKQKQITANRQNEDVIKDLKEEITELERRNTELEMVKQKQKTANRQNEDVIKDLKEEITELEKRNTELEMVKQKHITANRQNEDVIKDLKEEITELKKRNTELEMVKQKQKTENRQNEDVINDLKEEITELKKRNIELEMMKQKQTTEERLYEEVIKHLKEEITELKKRNTELKKRNTELEMVKQKQITAQRQNEDVIKDLKEETTELKKRNTEQQQKISNTEDDLRLIQEEHQKDLTRQQKSSSERSFKFWFLVVGVLFVLSAGFIQIHNHTQCPEAESLQSSNTQITELKQRNNELNLDIQRCKAESLQSSNTQITELKQRNNELNLDIQRCKAETLERLEATKTEISELKKRHNELNLVMQRREAEITELKKKNNELESQLKFCKAGPSENFSMMPLLIVAVLVWYIVSKCGTPGTSESLQSSKTESANLERINELETQLERCKAELKEKKTLWGLF